MPYPKADEPLSKITINLYSQDYIRLKVKYGRLWQDEVRRIVREHLGVPEAEEEIEIE